MIRHLGRLAFGCVFIASAAPKLMQPYDFLRAVYDYSLVRPRTGLCIALVLPWLELVLAISLVTGFLERGAWATVVVLMSIFTFAWQARHCEASLSLAGVFPSITAIL